MRMNRGVEWAVHACLHLAWIGADTPVTAARLAEFNELPPAYLNKQLQALARAGIVSSTPGPRGGFALARPPEQITMLDVVEAIDGPSPAFVCTEIRQRGPLAASKGDCRVPCEIASVMDQADAVWRSELAAQSIAEVAATVAGRLPQVPAGVRSWFVGSPAPDPHRVGNTSARGA
jgi:Rrf2 family protein